jgi:hypothetical protein
MRAPRPSPALIVASLALVVAGAQPVAAAVSALVPTNSVGTSQLKAGAVTTSKLHDGAVISRKITNGGVGLLDLAAGARPRPPKVYTVSDANSLALEATGLIASVVELDLPAGSWLVTAKTVASADATGAAADAVTCYLFAGETQLDSGSALMDVQSLIVQRYRIGIALSAVRTGSAHVEVRCGKTGNESVSAWVTNTALTAVRVTP